MNTTKMVYWLPRLIGAGLVLLTALLATDALTQEAQTTDQLTDFALHLLPTLLLLLIVIVAWMKPLMGGVFFWLLALAYAFFAYQHLQWVMSISLPLAIVGTLFMVSYRLENKSK